MFTLSIPTTPVNMTDEHEGFVLATLLREIADRIDGGESPVMRENRLARLGEPKNHPQINIVPRDGDPEWEPEVYHYVTRFNGTAVAATYELKG